MTDDHRSISGPVIGVRPRGARNKDRKHPGKREPRRVTRTRLAAPVVAMYWLMLVTGLVFYTAIWIDDLGAVTPLWPLLIGALGGTALGQFLALRDYRLWVAIAVTVAVLTWCVPVLPPEISSTNLWMAFVPAALCGFFSLSDRASLAAFWFPTVIWMLSILDRTRGQTTPDGAGIVLLGALAVLFLVFLRVRESRRVALWRTVAATPLAAAKPNVVLKEPPGRPLARGGWLILVSTITFGVTVWVAPHLWQTESFDGGQIQVGQTEVADAEPALGLPCCPVAWEAELARSRVTEYFDIGRGHDELAGPPRRGVDCRVCEGPAIAKLGSTKSVDGVIAGDGSFSRGVVPDEPRVPGSRAWTRRGGRYTPRQVEETDPWQSTTVPSVTPIPAPPEPIAPAASSVPDVPAPVPPQADPLPPVPPPSPTTTLPAPEPTPPLAAPVSPPSPETTPPLAAPVPPPSPEIVPPVPSPAYIDPPAIAPTPPVSTFQSHRPPAARLGANRLHWIAVIIAAALLFQLTSLALRPLRRWITLRHLRRPFWDETIDQRVSNSWQLALVGLRDAGWRSTSTEAPREFARRTGVEGLERCATILERARHGVALDAGDLSEMTTSADTAYHSARTSIGPFARAIAWIRWPLT
jgi:hypothetical protein